MATEKRLTEKDKIAYLAIDKFIKENGYPPSVRDLCRITGKASTATIQYRLKSLEKKGYIKTTSMGKRTIRITKWIEEPHTVDAVEVVHGRWEHMHDFIFNCTNCGGIHIVETCMGNPKWRYCPSCGANMRGGEE